MDTLRLVRRAPHSRLHSPGPRRPCRFPQASRRLKKESCFRSTGFSRSKRVVLKYPLMSNSMLLYRFMDERWGLESIIFRRFRISRLLELNDPFEWRFGIVGHEPEKTREADALVEEFTTSVNDFTGVICYSGSATQPVLWAHYANRHQGLVFEVNHPVGSTSPCKIQYTDKRPALHAYQHPNSAQERKDYVMPLIEQLRTQKSPGWSYEDEYRTFFNLAKRTAINGHFFTPIRDGFLKRVILGMKCRFEEDEIKKTLDAVGLTSTSVVRAQRCVTSYKVLY